MPSNKLVDNSKKKPEVGSPKTEVTSKMHITPDACRLSPDGEI